MALGLGPRTWTVSGTGAAGAVTLIVGATATPFGPSTVLVRNTHASAALSVAFSWGRTATVATETSDDNGFAILAGEKIGFNFNTQDSVMQLNISLISVGTATYVISAVQAQ